MSNHFNLPHTVPQQKAPEEIKIDEIPELKAKHYLKQILTNPWGTECFIIVPWGTGSKVVARVRTELSRLRQRMKEARKEVKEFKLYSEVKYGANAKEGDTIIFLIDDAQNAVKRELSDLAVLIADIDAQK